MAGRCKPNRVTETRRGLPFLTVLAVGLAANSIRAEDPLQIGDFQVTPFGSRIWMNATTGDSSSPDNDFFEKNDIDQPFLTQLNFNQSHAVDSNLSGSFGDHTAHAESTLECHVTPLGAGGIKCTISGSVNANTTDTQPPPNPFPLSDAIADTYFIFVSPAGSTFDWNYQCQISITDQSGEKDQGHVWVLGASSIDNGATPTGIPANLVLGGLVTNDGHGPSTQQSANISLSGTGYKPIFSVAPRIQVSAKHPGKPVSITMSITLTLKRVSGACCIPGPQQQCYAVQAADCALYYPGSTFKGVDTDCTSGSCAPTSDIHWANAVNGNYSNASMWTPQQVPESNPAASPPRHDIAIYDRPGGYTVTFPGAATSEIALVRKGLPTFLNATYQLKAISPTEQALQIGDGATLTLLNSPNLAMPHAVVGDLAPGTSTLNVFDSTMKATGVLAIGDLAPGKLNVTGSAKLDSADSRVGYSSKGDAAVNGNTAEWKAGNLAVAMGAAGTLAIQGGGKVTSDNTFIGYHNGLLNAVGDVTVQGLSSSGDSSKFKVDNKLTVGELGIGKLTLTNKGVGEFKDVTLAEFGSTSGTIIVHGPAAPNSPNLDVSGTFIIGKSGIGELSIDGGANVSCKSVILSQNSGSKGTLNVSGTDTLLGTGTENFVMAVQAPATLNILDGAKVSTAKAFVGNFGSATVLVRDGPTNGDPAWRLSGDLVMNGDANCAMTIQNAFVYVLGMMNMGSGLKAADILLTPSGRLKVDQNSQIGLHGHLLGSGLYACPFTQVIAPGMISPGVGVAGSVQVIKSKLPDVKQAHHDNATSDEIGRLTIDGDIQFDEGSILRIDVGGVADGQYDVLHITGAATLNGTLEVHFINGFAPQTAQVIPFLKVDGAMSGQFSEIKLVGAPDVTASGARFTDGVLEFDESTLSPMAPVPCGAGTCGAGITPLMLLSAIGITTLRMRKRQRRAFAKL